MAKPKAFPYRLCLQFLPATLIFLCCSCSSGEKKRDLVIIKALGESLGNSNKTLDNENMFLYHALHEKLTDPDTKESAIIWEPRAELIRNLSEDIINYMESLKNELIKVADFETDKGEQSFRGDGP